jgi:hypothetical protein
MPLLTLTLALESTAFISSMTNFPDVRRNKSIIVQKLFEMDIMNNSNESVLIGLLNVYTGSAGQADRTLLDVLKKIDDVRALNILSSQDTWCAFRNTRSQFGIEAVDSTLTSPFPLIDRETTYQNLKQFSVDLSSESLKDDRHSYERYDPEFWLPLIGYCLEKATRQADLSLLIDTWSIGYVLICLSSKDYGIRKMAGSILVRWEDLCHVSRDR